MMNPLIYYHEALDTINKLVLGSDSFHAILLKLFPFVLLFEIPFYCLIIIGVLIKTLKRVKFKNRIAYYPKVSCGLLCYAEGRSVQRSILSLLEQIYPGEIEILVVIDGAIINHNTTRAVKEMEQKVSNYKDRSLVIVPKRQRGGRVSSLNTILALCTGDIVMALDGDTSFDNLVVATSARHFVDPNVVAVAGNLRARNGKKNIITALQAIEYMLAIHLSKIALSEFNIINNVSGAFGIFRTSFLRKIGGWDAGTAEDLDLTTRIKSYFGRYPNLRILFEPAAMGYTDVPETVRQLLDQRLRWDGDLLWLYCRKHWMSFTPRLLGWKNFILTLWVGPYFQIISPVLILIYLFYSFVVFSTGAVLGILIAVYCFYFIIATLLYGTYIIFASDRPINDLSYAWLLVIFPFFTFTSRIWAAVACITELLLYTSKDTSMAPWWVSKQNKF